MIRVKRVYDPPSPEDGRRFLVDRLWPRGVKKDSLAIEAWLKEASPSSELREWYSHDPAKWDEFRRRYFAELDSTGAAAPLEDASRRGPITLLFSSKELQWNNAAALKEYLEKRRTAGTKKPKAG